jgi:hypothetical protein
MKRGQLLAKYERSLCGDFYAFLKSVENGILRGSLSASFEDGSDFQIGSVRSAVRVYERYSMIGQNRVSLNVTVVANGDDISVSAITSGGSQAMFFKINTWGEESFLSCLANVVEDYIKSA